MIHPYHEKAGSSYTKCEDTICLLNDTVRVKCEDLSSKFYRVKMTRMYAPIVTSNQRVKSLITQHSPQQKKTLIPDKCCIFEQDWKLAHPVFSGASLLFSIIKIGLNCLPIVLISHFAYTFIWRILLTYYKEVVWT